MKTLPYASVGLDMSAVEWELERALCSKEPAKEISSYLLKIGGKRFRPILVMTSASIYGADRGEGAAVAAAAELVHTASLIHDDIVDGARSRRGSPAHHSIWGPQISVLTGDYLFTRAFRLLIEKRQFAILDLFCDAVAQMCESEMEQAGQRFNLEITQEDCLEHSRKKTASLIEVCCKSGGIVGGAPSGQVERLGVYGRNLGMAFQITDDVLDLTGDPQKTGKPSGLDLSTGVLTLPILRLLKSHSHGEKARAILKRGSLNSSEVEDLRLAVSESGAVKETLDVTREYIEKAMSALDGLPSSWGRDSLQDIAQGVLERQI